MCYLNAHTFICIVFAVKCKKNITQMFIRGKQLQFGKSGVYIFENGCNESPDEILRAMLGGVDVLFVDPKLYPSLLEYSETLRSELLYKRQDDFVDKLEFFQNYMKEYPKREEYSRMFRTYKTSHKKAQKVYTPEQLQAEVNYVFENGNTKQYTNKQTQELVYEIVKKKQEALKKKDFAYAENCDFIIDSLTKSSQLNTVKEMQSSQLKNYSLRMSTAKSISDKNKMKWQNLLTTIQKKRSDDIASINRKFECEIHKIEEQKQKDPPLSRMKQSSYLLDLRRKEDALVQIRSYKEAEKLKAIADDLEKQETEQFIREWKQSLDDQIVQIKKNQQVAVSNREQFWQCEENTVKRDMESDVKVSEKRLDFLNNEYVQVKAARRETMSAITLNRLPLISGQSSNSSVSSASTKSMTTSASHNYFTEKVAVRQTPGEFRHRALFNMRAYTATPRKRLSSTI